MRRLYLAPKSVWLAAAHASLFHPGIGAHYIDLLAAGESPQSHEHVHERIRAAGHSLDTPTAALSAFHALEGTDEPHILISTAFLSETPEDAWHGHPSVAILPHPAFEGNEALTEHLGSIVKKFAQHHVDKLAAHPTLGYHPDDTVLTLARKATALHPQVKLRHIL